MDMILEHCKGCISIADDITVHGCTEEEHDNNLHSLMETACKNGLVFNPKKTQIKARSVKFFSLIFTEQGIQPDPEKVAAIHRWNPPQNLTQLQEFLGLVQFLSPFIPGLSTLTTPL